ncbi:hypothetical protein [Parvularcula dongshanensis]|uniref:Uncharacterized protein n=1 Tax=Parvularcula dongshanensis TaxID=1173995 RepID=A0A840I4R1_9PROT|nr:hypothetical protein [Parvularcula dongshanensis]MBB4659263.1 hypothetical protein [Parvularcula dongshanensis]
MTDATGFEDDQDLLTSVPSAQRDASKARHEASQRARSEREAEERQSRTEHLKRLRTARQAR